MQCYHAPRLGHDSAKLALTAKRLPEQTNIRGEHRKNCRPISDQRIHQSTVRNSDENHDIGNAIRQIVQNFTTAAGLASCERDQAVEHVEPEPQIAKKRSNDE